MISKLITLAAIIGITLHSCNLPKKVSDTQTSQNSIDWTGTYYGIMPCASCEGIETELTLKNDMNFILTTKYLGKEGSTYIKKGTFRWEGNKIKLEGIKDGEAPFMYKVEENQIRQMDLHGNEIKGELASNSILTKCGNQQIEDKRWKLIELKGELINGDAKTHYLIFHSKDNRIEAKTGCNVLLYPYKIRNKFHLDIMPGVSTLMACPDDLEQNFIKVLEEVDNLTFSKTSLSLNKGRMAPLARFELVEQ